jgi:glycosyltransferase involved in cell wall biosynthesis
VHVLSVVEGQAQSERTIEGVTVHRVPLKRPRGVGRVTRLPLTWRRISLAAAVAREARRLGLPFDVCESPEWNAEALVLAARKTLPVVVRLHSGASQLFPFLGPLGRDKRLAIRCEEGLIRRADVVTGTRSQVSDIGRQLGLEPEAVRTIMCPISPVDALPPAQGPPRVLFAGRFEARKGADVLLRALPRLLDRVPEAKLVFRGADTGAEAGGSYAAGLHRLIDELGIADAVEIVDRWDTDAVPQELRRCCVGAVPSRWESFGYVAAETSSLGRPVVAAQIPALEDLIESGVTGLLVPGEDPDAWSDALARLLSNPDEANSMGAAGARTISERCDPDRIAAETLDAYELAITRRQRR